MIAGIILIVASQSTIIGHYHPFNMICLRCGGCCLHLDIFVVNPDCIREDGCLDRHDPESMIFKPSGVKCPHLFFQPDPLEEGGGVAVCAIHHLPCYQGTPCQQFEQMGPEDDVCIMSAYFYSQIR